MSSRRPICVALVLALALLALPLVLVAPLAAENAQCTLSPVVVPPPPGEKQPLKPLNEFCSQGVRYCPQGDRSLGAPGGLNATLEMQYFRNVPVGSEKLSLRMYGYPKEGQMTFTVPALAYRIRLGETFNLTLRNCMQAAPPSPTDRCNPTSEGWDEFPNCYNSDNITNFHFHGFHISPKPNHDDVFLKLKPGDPDYKITSGVIPANQPPGTHWFHPHNHGSTALQVSNGAAGAFLVEGPFDDWLHGEFRRFGGLKEQLLVIQDVGDTIRFPPGSGSPRPELLINGQKSPVVPMAPGEIQRWRFVGGTMKTADDVRLRFPAGFEVRQIAMDGIQFHPKNYRDQPLIRDAEFRLAPGNRADFLVKAPATVEVHDLLYEVNDPQQLEREFRTTALRAEADPLFSVEVLDRAKTRNAAPVMEFPSTLPELPDYLRDIERGEVHDRDRTIVFSMLGDRASTDKNKIVRFYIDGKKFDHDCIDHRMKLGTAEEWLIENTGKSNVKIQHPAHIHVNPFQVVARNGVALPQPWVWQDTVSLPLWTDTKPGSVNIRHRFEDFEGKFVMHCHILGHEDRGMMQLLEIGNSSGMPLCSEKSPQAAPAEGHDHDHGHDHGHGHGSP